MTDTTNTNNSNPGWVTPSGNPAPSSSNLANKDLGSMARCTVGGTSYEVSMPFDGSEGKLITHQSSEYTAGKESAFQGSVIGSARTPGGNPVMDRKVSSRDMVSLPGGGTTTVAAAVHAGLLVSNPDGTYSDAAAKVDLKNPAEEARKGAPKEAGKGQPENAEFRIGDDGEAAMQAITSSVMPGDAIRSMDEILQRGEVSENTLARMASQAGIEPDQMREQINAAHQGFYDAAVKRLEAGGVANSEALEAFVQGNPQMLAKLAAGARDLVMGNGPAQIDEVKDAFLEQADRYMAEDVKDALEEAGYGWEDKPGSGLLVVLNGGAKVPFNVAVRQRVITFS